MIDDLPFSSRLRTVELRGVLTLVELELRFADTLLCDVTVLDLCELLFVVVTTALRLPKIKDLLGDLVVLAGAWLLAARDEAFWVLFDGLEAPPLCSLLGVRLDSVVLLSDLLA